MAERGGAGGRSTAIVLFTDLVGSTETRACLGEDGAEELRRRHDALVGGAIEAHRGNVVKHLGDGVMATFAGASDAVDAAVAVQQAIDRHNRSGAPLSVRIGISAGDVTFEEADCFGTPVIEAARLCAAAGGGRVLCSDLVRAIAGTGCPHGFRPVGALDLKGLPAPVPAVEVDWAAETGLAIPLPTGVVRAGSFPFVGREGELVRLHQVCKEALSGERRVVLVAGEPGVGKSRLVAEAARAFHAEGAVVLYGRCEEELGVPYQPFVEALRDYITACPPSEFRDQAGPLAGELTRLVPSLAERLPDLAPPLTAEPETERYRLLEAVRELVLGVSDAAPVVLFVDDLHWAAKPTLLMLGHLVHSLDAARLVILGTYRDTEISGPLAETLADLRRLGGVERMALQGLDEPGVAALCEAMAGHDLDAEVRALAHAVWAETEGNPFFVGEVLRHLAETGSLARQDERWRLLRPLAEVGIPEGVREVVGRRLSHLPEAANEVLAVAAVIGREFDVALLTEAAAAGEDAVLDALEAAEQARLVASARPGRYAFAHALVRSTLYDGLPSARRLRLHRRIGLVLETRVGAQQAELAYHFVQAAPLGEVTRAVAYARSAGDRSRADLAFEEAVVHYEHALGALELADQPDPGLRCDLRIAVGEALHRSGGGGHEDVLLEAAAEARLLGDPRRLAEVALSLNPVGFSSQSGNVDHALVALIEEALAGLGQADSPLRARLLAVLAVELTWTPDLERRIDLVTEATAMARRLGDGQALARILASAHFAIKDPDHLADRLTWTAELIGLGTELDLPELTLWGHLPRHDDLMSAGDVDAAIGELEAAGRLVDQLHQPLYAYRVATRRLAARLLRGQPVDGERLVEDASRVGQGGPTPDYVAGVLELQLFALRYNTGRLSESVEALTRLVESQPGITAWRPLLALALTEAGRADEARAHLRELTHDLRALNRDLLWITAMWALAMLAADQGDRERCALLYEQLLPYAGRTGGGMGFVAIGIVDVALGALAAALDRADDAERHFKAAAEWCTRVSAAPWLAWTRLEWAHMLLARRRSGDAERADELLRQALGAARELGLANIERRAVRLRR